MFVYKIYPTLQQTLVYNLCIKFSWHSSFDFVYKIHTKACRNVVYILHASVVYILYNFCIQNVYAVSVWDTNDRVIELSTK